MRHTGRSSGELLERFSSILKKRDLGWEWGSIKGVIRWLVKLNMDYVLDTNTVVDRDAPLTETHHQAWGVWLSCRLHQSWLPLSKESLATLWVTEKGKAQDKPFRPNTELLTPLTDSLDSRSAPCADGLGSSQNQTAPPARSCLFLWILCNPNSGSASASQRTRPLPNNDVRFPEFNPCSVITWESFF